MNIKANDFSLRILENISKVIFGKEEILQKVLAAVVSEGNILLNDVPGVGKTMLARSLAISLGLDFKRIQCTPDLLPTDITGLNILDTKNGEFIFRKGPIFTDVLLADELNRATPRTQSALLEAMAEKQVTIDGKTYKLSDNFFVIATQNPIEFEGTFPLPEAQLDRFTLSLSVGYPPFEKEIDMLKNMLERHPIEIIKPVSSSEELRNIKRIVREVHIDDSIIEYITKIVLKTRSHPDLAVGSSPRGSIALMNMARGLAFIRGRDFVIPDDVKNVAVDVLAHRVILKPEARLMKRTAHEIIEEIIANVKIFSH
ncbi:MAG TPA: MoxR family ATPase [Thermotogaceae bacterium]|nr:MoxR family ATPase [Thermotogota bacterium]HEW91558.1 MoxR family ATPase [Thermotogaceae bacterium]